MNRNFFEANKLVYLPAILPAKGLYCNNHGLDFEPQFWNNKGIWQYDNLLVSTYHAKEIKNFREELEIDNKVKILGDSGGFQAVTLGGDLNAKEVIKWQLSNCDAGLILDRPPYEFNNTAQFSGTPTEEFFNKCLQITYDNAKIALLYNNESYENHSDKPIRLYGVIQGETWQQMINWYKRMHELEIETKYEFNAWAMSPKPSYDPIKIAMFGIIALEYKLNKPIHILQVSGKGGIFIGALIRKLTGQPVTIDSSTWGVSARYGTAIDPLNIPDLTPVGQKLNTDNMSGWFCDCPICSKLKINVEKIGEKYTHYLNVHNLYQLAKITKYFDFMIQNKNEDIILIARRISKDCETAAQMLLDYKQFGFKYTANKYREVFNDENKINLKNQTNIFNF